MADLARDLPLDFGAHSARVHVEPDNDGGWSVSTEVDGRAVAADYCPDWRAVERFRARMQQWLTMAASGKARLSPAA